MPINHHQFLFFTRKKHLIIYETQEDFCIINLLIKYFFIKTELNTGYNILLHCNNTVSIKDKYTINIKSF